MKYLKRLIFVALLSFLLVGCGESFNYEGERVAIIGDSITEKNYHASTNYVDVLKEKLNPKEVLNYGLSRSTIAKKSSDDEEAMCIRYKKMDKDCELVIVAGGINDLGWNIPLGNIDSKNNEEFYGALNNMCKGLLEDYKNSRIVFLTPAKQSNYFNEINEVGLTLEDYSNAIITVAKKFNIEVFDNYELSYIEIDETTDGLHWNEKGHKIVGEKLSEYLLKQ